MNLNNSLRETPVAVVGLAAIFADAPNVETFWNNIIEAKDSIREVPDSRWSIADYYDADPMAPDKTYCKVGGFLPNIDFNPMEFGLPPNILEVTDASQLLGLVVARDALADAGYGKDSEKFTAELKAKTGVLLGVGGGQKLITPLIARLQYPIWEKALRSSGIAEADIPPIIEKMKKAYVGWNENSFPGLLGNVISGRITNRFDLGGINSVVDAACAASLSAIKMALSELVEGRCDMMLTGGVDTDNSPFMYMSFSKTPAFSKSGHITPFDDSADGMLIGEGVGMMVLKRLADAERDGDRIYSVIKGVGTSSDGRFKSVYAPRSSGQAMAMNRTYEEAGFHPSTVGLVEAHGTGTGAGDPTEFESMRMVFSTDNPKKQHIALGSVKSQVGHTKAAAGAAGMIKAVLALHHKVLAPTINVTQPNSKFDIENTPIYINTETRPWFKHGHPRRASVSAFGFGGINVHIAMEEYTPKHDKPYRIHQPHAAILFNAASANELLHNCQTALQQLQSSEANIAFYNLVNKSAVVNIPATNVRLGFVASGIDSGIDLLKTAIDNLQQQTGNWEHPKGIYYRQSAVPSDQKVVALFSGQGSQYVGMGRELVNAFPQMQSTFEKSNQLFEQDGKALLTDVVYPIPVFNKDHKKVQQTTLTKTQNAQPAIGTLSWGMYKVMTDAGFKADICAGHSFGELTALCAAGVIDESTFMALAKARGEAMALTNPGTDAGTMLAVKAPLEEVEKELPNLPGVQVANVNGTAQIVLGGSTDGIFNATNVLKSKGFSVVPLPVSAAFHTPFVQHAQAPFATVVDQMKFKSAKIPVFANTTATTYPKTAAAMQKVLKGQILNPVLFKNEIENIHAEGGRIFVEFGPKGVLRNLVKDILKDKEHVAVALNGNAKKDSDLQFRQAVVQLQVLGLPIQNIDPFKAQLAAPKAKSKMNVEISGNNYVSKPTADAYTTVMNNGFQIQSGGTQTIIKEVEKIVEIEKIVEVEKLTPVSNTQISNEEEMNKEQVQLMNDALAHLKDHQSKSMTLFENLMKDQNQQMQSFMQVLNQQMNAGTAPAMPKIVQETVYKAPATPIQNVVPQQPISNGNGNKNGKTTTAVVSAPAAQGSGLSKDQISNILLKVVSEKTGYPAEMLELNMDMEADLGIDSIKRVEIFGAITAQHPEVSGVEPQALAELRTLDEIVNYLVGKTGGTATTITAPATTVATTVVNTPPIPTPSSASHESGLSADQISNILLKVVSEKTGYPAEMLELNMDMEADLGIDSIKRVEIFGAITAQHPEVSGVEPQALAELRTLQEIVTYLVGKTGSSTTTVTTPVAQNEIVEIATPNITATPTRTTSNIDIPAILLKVVSEKTGYPAEMLELNMDMEADLGIDSIKRVEIFGAITAQHPEVSGVDPQALAELRTLQQIVDYLNTKTGASNATPIANTVATSTPVQVPTSNPTNTLSDEEITNILLKVVSEKTGYPAEMLELNMDMEADLGIDSIKRVEIFGAITAQHPEVSGVEPQALAELRTLQEIVDYLATKKKVLN